ncbi:hypothetical protein [Microbacterium sp. RURRCA19A]|uniref:hypothetical protein n=1 Tax=Microbacterium sp. RURRCA19A TaxID=1907391 RepID=UPI0009559DCA|nr:hypothetical protein [Microbacterium sp. RURRCA19A]SIS15102.1 hypothetical protein SAMN05880568_3121 [Microbacterium sp. RURRCA19A]
MPRITNSDYLAHRKTLPDNWKRSEQGWSKLNFEDQCTLHEYYEPSMDFTDDQAIAYRQAVTAKWPSLPHRAGKAYAEFTKIIARLEATPPPPKKTPGRRRTNKSYVIRTEGLVRPDVDFDKLARVLLAIARDKDEKKAA